MRITVISPLFPTKTERYRGNFIYNTVRSLQKHADLEVLCPQMSPLGLSLIQRVSKRSQVQSLTRSTYSFRSSLKIPRVSNYLSSVK